MLWFDAQGQSFKKEQYDWGSVLYFSELGELRLKTDGSVDAERSPVVTVHFPRVVRGILWTVGEVRFLPMPLQQFPELNNLRKAFLRWFNEFPVVCADHPAVTPQEFAYFLEGTAKNFGTIRAFSSGLKALERGQYFISDFDTGTMLDVLCKKLALRGILCGGKT